MDHSNYIGVRFTPETFTVALSKHMLYEETHGYQGTLFTCADCVFLRGKYKMTEIVNASPIQFRQCDFRECTFKTDSCTPKIYFDHCYLIKVDTSNSDLQNCKFVGECYFKYFTPPKKKCLLPPCMEVIYLEDIHRPLSSVRWPEHLPSSNFGMEIISTEMCSVAHLAVSNANNQMLQKYRDLIITIINGDTVSIGCTCTSIDTWIKEVGWVDILVNDTATVVALNLTLKPLLLGYALAKGIKL